MTATTAHEGEPILAWLARRTESARLAETQFDDASLEYRRLFSEVWGTFLLVLVAAGGGVIGATSFGGDLTLPMKALAPGMMVMGVIFFMGTISGRTSQPRRDPGLRRARQLPLATGAGLYRGRGRRGDPCGACS